jgi:Flp pilus assembly pilin Flp
MPDAVKTEDGGVPTPDEAEGPSALDAAEPCLELSAHPRNPRGEVKRMTYLNAYITRLLVAARREEGQTMAEYGVILAVITVAIIAVLVLLSDGIRNNLQAVVDALS